MTEARSLWAAFALACCLGANLLWTGCATAEKAYASVFEGLAKAEQKNGDFGEQFPAINRAKVKVIVDTAPSEADGNKSLDEWKVTAERLVRMVEGNHASAQLIRDAVAQIRVGVRSKAELAQWAEMALRLWPDLQRLLVASGVRLEGSP